ncbi:MAG: ATP-binding protein [Planctomycetota bacterium]|nr:ATP-binding protein [Planctomycetota bacterium]MDG2142719.1 ATP-binding protein [Planctomycetota bacterium]
MRRSTLLMLVLAGAVLGACCLIFLPDEFNVTRGEGKLAAALLVMFAWVQIQHYLNARKVHRLARDLAGVRARQEGTDGAGGDELTFWDWVRRGTTTGRELDSLTDAAQKLDATIARVQAKANRGSAQRQLILKSMADGLLAVDMDQRIVLSNKAAATMLNMEGGDQRGMLLVDATNRKEAQELVERCINKGRRVRERTELLSSGTGSVLVLDMRASPLKSESGEELAGCVLVIEDRTELERLERVRRDFVANVSHELKTPLTSVRGYLETLLEDPDIEPQLRARFLDKANRNAHRLSAIVGDLIALARAESDEGDVLHSAVELQDVVRSAVGEAQATADEKCIHLVTRIKQGVAIQGDRAALETALLNLVENAIQYSPGGTEVEVALTVEGGSAILAVTDQGPGILAEHMSRLFERFYRVDKDRSRSLGGTGLGLSIVRNVAAAHGGTARVESELGKGSRFWIELPRA